MTIKKAIDLFNRLVSETTNKREIRVYSDFIEILNKLEKREFAKAEMDSIERKLDELKLNRATPNKKRHFKRALQQFKSYLNESFSLVSKGYYINLGLTYGPAIGLLVGVFLLSNMERSTGISVGIAVGAAIGLVVASYLEAQAKTSGNLI